MISRKKVHFSAVFLFALLLVSAKLALATPGDPLADNNLYDKAPFWYPCHDWKFTWFIPCTYTPVVNLTLNFIPPVVSSYSLPPIIFGARSFTAIGELLLSLPERLVARIISSGESFTPVIYPSVTFIPSSGLGGPGGFLGSPESYGGDPGAGSPGSFPPGAPPVGPDLTVDLPPITFDPIVDPPSGPIVLILPVPDPVLSVPIPPVLGSPAGPASGSDEPIPAPGVPPPDFVPPFGLPVPTPPPAPSPALAPIPTPSEPISTTPSSVAPGIGDTFGDFIDGIGDFFGDILGGGGDWDFGDAPDGDIAYPDTAGGGGL